MSRDFMPAELFLNDILFKEKNGKGLRDAKIIYKVEGKPDKDLVDWKAREQFPELSFLFDDFDSLFKRYENDERVLGLFSKIENALLEVEARFLSTKMIITIKKCLPITQVFCQNAYRI